MMTMMTHPFVAAEEGVHTGPLLGAVHSAQRHVLLVADETDEARRLAGRVQKSPRAQGLYVRAHRAVCAVLVLTIGANLSLMYCFISCTKVGHYCQTKSFQGAVLLLMSLYIYVNMYMFPKTLKPLSVKHSKE